MESQIHFRGSSAYWKNFKWGVIIYESSTFQVISRSQKNVFRLFNGLGLNEELLYLLKEMGIKFIQIPFKSSILKTTVQKWISFGIKSPFVSDTVDQQLILRLDKINLDEAEPPQVRTQSNKQLSFFDSCSENSALL